MPEACQAGTHPLVLCENLHFSYSGAPPFVLAGLDLELSRASYTSILGVNGCGKSTLVRLILGLLSPTSGRLQVDTRARAYVPQQKDSADSRFPITVLEMLESYRRLLGIRDRGATTASLEALHLQGLAGRLLGSLSGGQRQKVLLARALLGSPALLVLDEPSTGIDPQSQEELYAQLRVLNKERGMTILSVEHNLEAALKASSVIYHMSEGRGHACDPGTYARESLGRLEGGSNAL